MKFDTEYIEKLAKIINENGLTEISLEDNEEAITIRKESVVAVAASSVAAPVQASSAPAANAAAPAQAEETKPAPKGKAVTSPMVGTFYAAPSPDADAFVEIGKEVSEGDVVCIIEAMKLMNEIKSEHSGKVTQICVQNGDPVEYGQVLMYLE